MSTGLVEAAGSDNLPCISEPEKGFSKFEKCHSRWNGVAKYQILDLDVDPACRTSVICDNSTNKHISLLQYDDIPSFLKGNPFIHSGYRAFLPLSLCLRSLFVWSNESMNIWSHLFGYGLFLGLMFLDNFVGLPYYHGTFADHVFVTFALLCFQFCMLCSTGFHLFYCHSERACKRWLSLDLAGVSIGVIGMYLPAIHFGFHCFPTWRDIYLLIISVLTATVLWIQTNPRHLSESFYWQRILLYVCLTGYGFIPTCHWVYLLGGVDHPLVQEFVPRLVAVYSLGLVAVVFYVLKFPERLFPGKVDYIGHSHQWWHGIVLITFLYWHGTGIRFLQIKSEYMCDGIWKLGSD